MKTDAALCYLSTNLCAINLPECNNFHIHCCQNHRFQLLCNFIRSDLRNSKSCIHLPQGTNTEEVKDAVVGVLRLAECGTNCTQL